MPLFLQVRSTALQLGSAGTPHAPMGAYATPMVAAPWLICAATCMPVTRFESMQHVWTASSKPASLTLSDGPHFVTLPLTVAYMTEVTFFRIHCGKSTPAYILTTHAFFQLCLPSVA